MSQRASTQWSQSWLTRQTKSTSGLPLLKQFMLVCASIQEVDGVEVQMSRKKPRLRVRSRPKLKRFRSPNFCRTYRGW